MGFGRPIVTPEAVAEPGSWSVSVEDREVRRLTQNDDLIQAFSLSPDGRRAATVKGTWLS